VCIFNNTLEVIKVTHVLIVVQKICMILKAIEFSYIKHIYK